MNQPQPTLPILRQENVQLIVSSAPKAYDTNALSSMRCADFGKALLEKIRQFGMSDDLDRQCAEYIEKAKRTLKAMNERRTPLTKLFDQIRSEFTGMENTVDPSKKDTVPFQIQQARNAFAARKREEAERLRQEEMRRQQHAQAVARYTQDTEDDYRRTFDLLITDSINTLTDLNKALTLANFDEQADRIRNYSSTLGNEWFRYCQSHARKPVELTDAEATDIRQSVLNRLSAQFKEQYAAEIGEYRDTIADALPAKKAELERMAKADAEEQARIQADLRAREAAEARRLEEARKCREDEANAARQVKQQATEMDGLFGQAAIAAPAAYQPKTAVRKRIAVGTADGILDIVSLWWSKEGQFLPVDELARIFKKQITFCEKLANDKANPELITSGRVRYEDEVKAK